jgi:RNA polymerase subunit RPABC4/transcription elongation factor Spt4
MTSLFPRPRWGDAARAIPRWAYALALAVWVAIQLAIHWAFTRESHPPHVAFQVGFGLYIATVFSPLVLLAGFVSADSRDRGMRSPLWTALALVPPGLGALVYLLLRAPKAIACGRCGRAVREGSAYCTSCGQALGTPCPHCGRETRADDAFCAHCGSELAGRPDGPPAAGMDHSHH